MSMRDADEHHAVYRQASILTIRDVERELEQKHTREHVKAGGLFCSHGSEMTFVICSKRTNHFRHLVTAGFRNKSKDEDVPGNGLVPGTSCGCSSRHLDAQALLRDHDYSRQPVVFTEWRDCLRPECCRTVYKAEGRPSVRLEVREENGKFVSDVVYYREDDGEPCMRVEVLASHKADRARRAGTEFVEVQAYHVAESFKQAGYASSVTLRCEGSCTGHHEICHPCVERKRIARERAEAARKQAEAAREQAEARRREVQRREAERQRIAREQAEALRIHEVQRREAERVRMEEDARKTEEAQIWMWEIDNDNEFYDVDHMHGSEIHDLRELLAEAAKKKEGVRVRQREAAEEVQRRKVAEWRRQEEQRREETRVRIAQWNVERAERAVEAGAEAAALRERRAVREARLATGKRAREATAHEHRIVGAHPPKHIARAVGRLASLWSRLA